MNYQKLFCVLLLIFSSVLKGQDFHDFLNSVRNAEQNRRIEIIDNFMQSEKEFPIIEDTMAHFIFNSFSSAPVIVTGDFNGWSPEKDTMTNVPGTNFQYLTKIFEKDARIDYKFVKDGTSWILDPLNSKAILSGFGQNSELAMGDYRQPREIEFYSDIFQGNVSSLNFHSDSLNNSRQIYVYLPPKYDDKEPKKYPVVYVNDGEEYKNIAKMNNILDYLIAHNKIEECIVVFINPVKRNTEYWINTKYMEMIVKELVPYIDSHYRTIDKPDKRCIMGASLGGLISVYICYHYPQIIGLCASQSGAFWVDDNRIINLLFNGERKNISFYLDWGSYEPSIQKANKLLLSTLNKKEYFVKTNEFHEGHSWGNWRAHIDNILIQFFPKSK